MERAPRHVAIIMDGNGRWANARGLARIAGHKVGVDRVREIVRACPDVGVTHLTLFAFSTENWKRPALEIAGLMRIFRNYIQREAEELERTGVRVRFIGERARLDRRLQDLMAGLEARTARGARLQLTVAINYGARDEIARAMTRVAQAVASGDLDAADVREGTLADYMDTSELPDPDLVIRTSGEQRLSNFLLWQAAYAELVFVSTPWPDFTVREFRDCLDRFGSRDRRFGAVRV